MDKTAFIQLLKQNDERIALFFGADISDPARIPLAVQFTFSRETFNGPKFKKNTKEVHRQKSKQTFAEFFFAAPNNPVLAYKILAHLALHPEPEQELNRLKINEQTLTDAGFKKSGYQQVAALFLLDEAHAVKAKVLHEEMKRHHFFLTGKDDIPYAVLLAKNEEDPVQLAQTMRSYYDVLHSKGLKSGNGLQAMTQLLSLYEVEFQPALADDVITVKQSLIKKGVKVEKKFYPYLALLALLGPTSEVVNEITEMQHVLAKLPMFTNMQEYAFMTAVQYVLKNLIENGILADVNDSLLFMQALEISDFIGDMPFFLALDILDIFM